MIGWLMHAFLVLASICNVGINGQIPGSPKKSSQSAYKSTLPSCLHPHPFGCLIPLPSSTMATKKKSKGRQKIDIKEIENLDARQVCFSKRRDGLFKKASELNILTGAEVAIVAYSPGGKPFSFGHPSVESVINHYLVKTEGGSNPATAALMNASEVAHRRPLVMELAREYTELCARLEAQRKMNEANEAKARDAPEGSIQWSKCDIDKLGVAELEQYYQALQELGEEVRSKTDLLNLNMACPSYLAGAGSSSGALPQQMEVPQLQIGLPQATNFYPNLYSYGGHGPI